MEDLIERIRQLEHENEILKIKVDRNTGDCDQLWMILRMSSTKSGIPSFGKVKLNKKSVAALTVSLLLGASSSILRVAQFIGWI